MHAPLKRFIYLYEFWWPHLVPGTELRFWSLSALTHILTPPLQQGMYVFSDLGVLMGEIGAITIVTHLAGLRLGWNERRWRSGQGRLEKGIVRDPSPFTSLFQVLSPEYFSPLLFSCYSLNSGTNFKHHRAENCSVVRAFTLRAVSGSCSELMIWQVPFISATAWDFLVKYRIPHKRGFLLDGALQGCRLESYLFFYFYLKVMGIHSYSHYFADNL